MRGWTVLLFIAAVAAGLFAFGVIATPYLAIARTLFFVFATAFVIVLLIALFTSEHGGAMLAGGRTIALAGVIGGIAALVYFWNTGDWNAERVGRVVDRQAAAVSANARLAFNDARQNLASNNESEPAPAESDRQTQQ
jgi:uncharacterized membrane protein YtjA (UPF0391 family)